MSFNQPSPFQYSNAPMPPAQQGSSSQTPRFTPLDPIRLLRQYWPFLLVALILGLGTGIGLTIVLKKYSPLYTATAVMRVVPPPSGALDPTTDMRSRDESLEVVARTETYFIQSEEILRNVLKRKDIMDLRWFNEFKSETERLRALSEALRVAYRSGTRLINVSVSLPYPRDAQALANEISRMYQQRAEQRTSQTSDDLVEIFRRRRDELRQFVTTLENQRNDVMDTAQFSASSDQFSVLDMQFKARVKDLDNTTMSRKAAEQAYATLVREIKEGTFNPSAEDLARVENDPAIRGRDDRMMALSEERRILVDRFGEDHRAVKEIDLRMETTEIEMERKRQELLREMRDLRQDMARSQLESLMQREARMIEELKPLEEEWSDLQRKIAMYEQLDMKLRREEGKLDRLEDLLNNVQLQMTRPDAVSVQLSQAAELPSNMSFPRFAAMVPQVTFGFLALVGGLIVLKELMDQRIKSPACCKLLPECNLLGVIPNASEEPSGKIKNIENVVVDKPESLITEAYRQARTGIIRQMERGGHRTMMVVGAQPDAGVSAVASNIADSLALIHRRVILVDVNFRRPAQHRLHAREQVPGLGELLSGTHTLEQVISATQLEGVDLLPVGTAGPDFTEQLGSRNIENVLENLRERYDFVIIDAPPLSIIGDSRLLANRVDAIVLVARAMQARRGLVGRVMQQMKDASGDLIGLILNDVRGSAGGYFRRNFREFYEYQNGSFDRARKAEKRHAAPRREEAYVPAGTAEESDNPLSELSENQDNDDPARHN